MKLAIVNDNEIEQEIILNTLNAYHLYGYFPKKPKWH